MHQTGVSINTSLSLVFAQNLSELPSGKFTVVVKTNFDNC